MPRIAWLGAALVATALVGVLFTRRSGSVGGTMECRLSVPGSSVSPMLFPSKVGSEALDAAIVGNADDSTVTRVISEQGGFTVPRGTSCSELEAGPVYSRVLVTGGAFAGKSAWAPSIHTHGK